MVRHGARADRGAWGIVARMQWIAGASTFAFTFASDAGYQVDT